VSFGRNAALDRERTGSPRPRQALRLFAGIAGSYQRVSAALSLGQDPRWRRVLVASVAAKRTDRVLDVATGTGLVARALANWYGCRVVGLDQSAEMLAAAAHVAKAGRSAAAPCEFVRAEGERLPFLDESFDHVTFTYLLRYVDDPATTVCELTRVLRPGGRLAALEFGIPPQTGWRWLWRLYTRVGLPLAGRVISPAWGAVGDFLGPSIERFYAEHPQAALERYWHAAGLEGLCVRRMSLGGGTVMTATKTVRATRAPGLSIASPIDASPPTAAAFYALRPGGWRDYWTLLHPPYTAWHLSYVLLGAALAPAPDPRIVLGAVMAFGLAVGISSHAFDELQGRPLGTRIPAPVLAGLAAAALAVAAALGVAAATVLGLGPGFLAIVAIGVLLVVAYGFELPLVHSDLGFAIAWGAFPVVATAYAVGAPPFAVGVTAFGAALLSLAQRRLSAHVRSVRRRAIGVTGLISYRDGSQVRLDTASLIAAPEAGLRLLWLAALLIAAGALAGRWI
jgi:demethylmenaquinone methyltransferase / 2-methoxy-6-polyprenyl-1,4-benzoquinol methylase